MHAMKILKKKKTKQSAELKCGLEELIPTT
jgi:hypothetical protein